MARERSDALCMSSLPKAKPWIYIPEVVLGTPSKCDKCKKKLRIGTNFARVISQLNLAKTGVEKTQRRRFPSVRGSYLHGTRSSISGHQVQVQIYFARLEHRCRVTITACPKRSMIECVELLRQRNSPKVLAIQLPLVQRWLRRQKQAMLGCSRKRGP